MKKEDEKGGTADLGNGMIPIIGISKQAACICLQIYIYTTE